MSFESARISGLGLNNYIARYDDSHTWLVNPAGLASLEENQAISTYEERFSGSLVDGTACLTLKNLGFKINYVTVPGIERRNDSGVLEGEFSLKEYDISAAYGYQANPALSLGAGVNLHTKSAGSQNNLGGSVKVGALYRLMDNVSLGAVVEDIGVQSSLNKEAGVRSLPATLRAGFQVSPVEDLYLLGGGSFTGSTRPNWNVGTEYRLLKVVSFRVGYDAAKQKYGPLSGGFGVNIQNICQIDYGYNSHPTLGSSGIVSLTFHFKSKTSKASTQPPAN